MKKEWDSVSVARSKGVKEPLMRVMNRAKDMAPWPIRITEGLRTIERQRQLVAAKASKTMKSRHLTGDAVDVVPYIDLDRDGKIETEELYSKKLYEVLIPIIKEAARIEGVAIVCGHDWGWDSPHIQLDQKVYP